MLFVALNGTNGIVGQSIVCSIRFGVSAFLVYMNESLGGVCPNVALFIFEEGQYDTATEYSIFSIGRGEIHSGYVQTS